MSTVRQIEANRRNACLSTGPVTDEGKRRSRQNAVRHGLTAETVITSLEDAEDYAAFEMAITAEYDAQSAVERELVLRLASLLWRLRRATAIETGLFEIQARQLLMFRQARQSLDRLSRYEGALWRQACQTQFACSILIGAGHGREQGHARTVERSAFASRSSRKIAGHECPLKIGEAALATRRFRSSEYCRHGRDDRLGKFDHRAVLLQAGKHKKNPGTMAGACSHRVRQSGRH